MMRTLVIVLLSTLVLDVACAPYVTSYRHVYFAENERVVVDERDSGVEQSKVLYFVRHDVPLKAHVTGTGYTVEIWTPLSSAEPVVGLRALASDGATLFLEGPNVLMLNEGSGGYLQGYRYVFLVDDARGRPLQIQVKDVEGRLIGKETLSYTIRSRGRFLGIDTL